MLKTNPKNKKQKKIQNKKNQFKRADEEDKKWTVHFRRRRSN